MSDEPHPATEPLPHEPFREELWFQHTPLRAAREYVILHRRFARLQNAMAAAWRMFQESGVMREPDGRTGNDVLDDLGSHLDEWASEIESDGK